MIKSNLRVLIAQKEQKENRRLSYQTISDETGISTSGLYVLANNRSKMIGFKTLNALCFYFDCTPSDILLYVPTEMTV